MQLLNKDHATCRKERFIETQTVVLPLSGSECISLDGMGRGLYRRGHPVREDSVPPRQQSGCWPPFILSVITSGGIVKGGIRPEFWKFVRSSGTEVDGFSQTSFADKASHW
jgi:hypothetical protein